MSFEIPYTKELKALQNLRPLYMGEKLSDIPTEEGVYALWWDNSDSSIVNRETDIVKLKGRKVGKKSKYDGVTHEGHHLHEVILDWNLGQTLICLYVGKSTNILKRIKWHLATGVSSSDWRKPVLRKGEVIKKYEKGFVYKRDSMSQFRAGIEHLGFNQSDIKSKVLISTVRISGHNSVADRFYLEDLAIGLFRPWFNVDSER